MSEGAVATKHRLHDSIDELLSAEAMSRLEGRTVTSVSSQPWMPDQGSASGCPFLKVESIGRDRERRHYVVKRTSRAWDIIMRVTGDTGCRELLVWQHGLLDRLPDEVTSPIVGGARDGDGWAILMRDIGDTLRPYTHWPGPGWEAPTRSELARAIDSIAALHAQYWQDASLDDPALGLCTLPWLYRSFSPQSAHAEAGSPHDIVRQWRVSGQLLEEKAPADIVSLVQGLRQNLLPLCDALRRYPWTLVHGDLKRQNVGLERGSSERAVLLDWQFAMQAPPAVDLSWFLGMFACVSPISPDDLIEAYRARLAARLGPRYDDSWWQPQLELALLGNFLRQGGGLIRQSVEQPSPEAREHFRELVAWWIPHLRRGAALL